MPVEPWMVVTQAPLLEHRLTSSQGGVACLRILGHVGQNRQSPRAEKGDVGRFADRDRLAGPLLRGGKLSLMVEHQRKMHPQERLKAMRPKAVRQLQPLLAALPAGQDL